MPREITRAEIEAGADRIGPYVRRTPILELGQVMRDRYRVTLKLDSMQPTGSFKVRGAFSDLIKASVPDIGLAAASGGNFALAVAYAAGVLGHRATVFVPETAPHEKIRLIGELGLMSDSCPAVTEPPSLLRANGARKRAPTKSTPTTSRTWCPVNGPVAIIAPVSDEDLVEAQRWLWETCRVPAEPAACAPIAALSTGAYVPADGEHVVAVISGANMGLRIT